MNEPVAPKEKRKPFRPEEWTDIVKLYESSQHIAGLKRNGSIVAC